MNNEQEMQFADPAWQPKVTREFEAISPTGTFASGEDVTSTSQAGEAVDRDYAQGYRAQSTRPAGSDRPFQSQQPPTQDQSPPFAGQQPPFQAQQAPPLVQQLQDLYKRLPAWAWWVIGILVLSSIVQSAANQGGALGALFSLLLLGALACGGWLLFTRRVRISLTGETQASETRTFTVGAQPTLVLKNKAGSIHLHAGQAGQVQIATTRRGYLFSQRFDRETPVLYRQDQATNTVTAQTGNWHLFGKNAITLDVTVPPEANLQLNTDFGSISVENVAGQINLRTNAGTIQASQVTLKGKSRLKTDAGTIDFSGSLEPGGKYELKTDLGTINATLLASSDFELSAHTDLGTISTNLPLVPQKRNSLNGIVGSSPNAHLRVRTDVGTINIQQQ